MTDIERGLTVDVGINNGGEAVNIVAPSAEAEIDPRYITPTTGAEAPARIEEIVNLATTAGTTTSLAIQGDYLPLVPTASTTALYEVYRQTSADLGTAISGGFSGESADSGYISAVGCPTLRAVGPADGKAHTPDEYLEIATIVPRAQVVALAIMRMSPR